MPDKFDPYREALIMETNTVWSSEFDSLDRETRKAYEASLHADAASAQQLTYVRLHTGFCRVITVTAEDLARVQA